MGAEPGGVYLGYSRILPLRQGAQGFYRIEIKETLKAITSIPFRVQVTFTQPEKGWCWAGR